MSGFDTLLRATSSIYGYTSQKKMGKFAANRILQIGERDARLRTLQGAQLLGTIKSQQAKAGVTGPTTQDVLASAARLESEDVERYRFAAQAQADQTRANYNYAATASLLGLSTVFMDELDRRKRKKREAAVDEFLSGGSSSTALGQAVPNLIDFQ